MTKIDIVVNTDKSKLKEEYQTAVTRLEQIRDATNPTNAQVIAAVRDLAKYQLLLLKFLKRLLV